MSQMSKAEERERRRDIARQALEVGMNDPYWLHNLSVCTWLDEESWRHGIDSMIEELEQDIAAFRTARERLDGGDWVPAEAALHIAEQANLGDYSTHDYLYDRIPIDITEEGEQ